MCPCPEYKKFGKTLKEREINFDNFLDSKELEKLMTGLAGCVVKKDKIANYLKKVKSKKGKKILKKIYKKLKPIKYGNTILGKTFTESGKKAIERVLLHEWIHVLLSYNKIDFQHIRKKLWILDEGLTTYIETSFSSKRFDISKILEKRLEKCSAGFKIYGTNALKFNKLLKDKNTPKERNNAIKGFHKKQRIKK